MFRVVTGLLITPEASYSFYDLKAAMELQEQQPVHEDLLVDALLDMRKRRIITFTSEFANIRIV